MTTTRIKLGARQLEAVKLYVFDPVHLEFYEDFPEDAPPASLALEGSTLVFDSADAWPVARHLIEAANSADDEAQASRGDRRAEFAADRDALSTLARRISRVQAR